MDSDELDPMALECFTIALSAPAWQMYGFPTNPAVKQLFNWVRPRWKIDLEKRLMREITITTYAAYVVAKSVSVLAAQRAFEHSMKNTAALAAHGYESTSQASLDFREQIGRYTATDPSEWSAIMLPRVGVENIEDQKLKTRVMFGCFQVGDLPKTVAMIARQNQADGSAN